MDIAYALAALAYGITVAALVLLTIRVRQLLSVYKKGQPDPTRSGDRGARLKNMLTEVLGHTKMLNFTGTGIAHWFVMIAPETLTAESAVMVRIKVPVDRSTAVRVVVPAVISETRPAEPVVAVIVPSAALADGTATTESSPAPSAVTAASAMRLRSVFVDIFFLSLVSCGNFPKLARRSVKIF